jgi:alpha-mannosidase
VAVDTVFVLHHSHVDRGYMHHPSVTEALQGSFLDHALELASNGSIRGSWTVEVFGPLLDWLENATDSSRNELRALVARGAIGLGAMPWHTTPLASRSDWAYMLSPLERLRELTGDPMRTALQHDVNGLPWGAIDFLADSGVDTLLTGVNIDHGGLPGRRHDVWRWRSRTGASLAVYTGDHYGAAQRIFRIHADRTLDDMTQGWDEYTQSAALPTDRSWIMLTATAERIPDCNGPWPLLYQRINAWNAVGGVPRIVLATPEDIRSAIRELGSIPEQSGDWTDYWNFGCGATAQATARSRAARVMLDRAMSLGSDAPTDRWHELTMRANHMLMLYAEHTWGARGTLPNPPRHDSWQQATTKVNLAAEAAGIGCTVTRVQADRWIGNPVTGRGCEAIALFNDEPCSRWMTPSIPASWLDGSWRHGLQELLAVDDEVAGSLKPWTRIAPVEVPAHSCRIMPITDIDTTPSPGFSVGSAHVTGNEYAVSWSSADGALTRCEVDGASLTSRASEFPPLHPVVETVDASGTPAELRRMQHPTDFGRIHRDLSCWQPDWPATRSMLTHLDTVACTHDAAGVHIERRWSLAPFGDGWVSVELHVSARAYEPIGVELAAYLPNGVRPFGLYLTFPMPVEAGWSASFRLLDVEARLDDEQIPGTSRDWITADSYAVQDQRRGVAIDCPSAPLIMPNGPGYGRMSRSIERSANPLVLGWVANNYWDTNFPASQPGFVRAGWWLRSIPHNGHTYSLRTSYGDQFAHPVVGYTSPGRVHALPDVHQVARKLYR